MARLAQIVLFVNRGGCYHGKARLPVASRQSGTTASKRQMSRFRKSSDLRSSRTTLLSSTHHVAQLHNKTWCISLAATTKERETSIVQLCTKAIVSSNPDSHMLSSCAFNMEGAALLEREHPGEKKIAWEGWKDSGRIKDANELACPLKEIQISVGEGNRPLRNKNNRLFGPEDQRLYRKQLNTKLQIQLFNSVFRCFLYNKLYHISLSC